MRKSPVLQIEELDGDKYPDRDTAQRAALPLVSANGLAVFQDLLARGVLVIVDGKMIPNPKSADPKKQPLRP